VSPRAVPPARPGRPARATAAKPRPVAAKAVREARLAALADVAALVRDHAEPGVVLERALARLAVAVPFESATFFLLDEITGELGAVAAHGGHVDLIPDVRFDLGTGLSSWVARTGRPVLLPELRGEVRADAPDVPRHGSFVSVPVVVQRATVGVLNAGSTRAGALTEADRDLLVAAAATLAAPLVAKRAARDAARRPGTDFATGLPNRLAFEEKVAEAVERGRRYAERCAVVVLTVDGVDRVRRVESENAAGDLLAAVGRVLAAHARKSDIVARLVPDDAFALLLPHQGEEAARRAAGRLAAALDRHAFPGRRRVVTSVGVAPWPAATGPGSDPFVAAAACAQELVVAAIEQARPAPALAPADPSLRAEAA